MIIVNNPAIIEPRDWPNAFARALEQAFSSPARPDLISFNFDGYEHVPCAGIGYSLRKVTLFRDGRRLRRFAMRPYWQWLRLLSHLHMTDAAGFGERLYFFVGDLQPLFGRSERERVVFHAHRDGLFAVDILGWRYPVFLHGDSAHQHIAWSSIFDPECGAPS